MATKTTTVGKGCDIRSRDLLPRGVISSWAEQKHRGLLDAVGGRYRSEFAVQQGNGDTGIAAELQWVSSPQEEARYFPGTAPHGGARDEDAEVSSLEALIPAVLNSNTEALDAVESLD
jgi:hypothetical protein